MALRHRGQHGLWVWRGVRGEFDESVVVETFRRAWPGATVVNIDYGFGAAYAASLMNRL